MRRMLEKAVGNEMMRYLFFGVCTTVVNLGMFTALRYKVGLNVRISNLLSIITAIVFAFLVNKWFVFQSGRRDVRAIAAEFINFTGMRCITLLVEFWGVCVLVDDMHIADFTGKLLIQVVVVVLNYMISKCYVFKEEAV